MSSVELLPFGASRAVVHDPFAGPAIVARIPLSESQREVWLAAQMQPEANLAYTEGLALTLSGPLDHEALRIALEAIQRRHDLLRATISPDGGWLCVHEPQAHELPVIDCSGGEGGRTRRSAEATEMGTPFDLEKGPLVRFRLLRTAAQEHVLLFIAHHIIVDGWSSSVLLVELGEIYSAHRRGERPALADAPHFGDYVDSERAFLESERGASHSQFWLGQLHDAPVPPELPSEGDRPDLRTYRAHRIDHPIPPEIVRALRRLGADHGASLVATTLAAFAALLRRVTGADDLVIGLAAAGQSFHGYERLVGHCVNFLPLRMQPRGDVPFSRFLADARSSLLSAFEHQGTTFGYLLPKLRFRRDARRPPLVSIAFNVDVRDDVIGFDGLSAHYDTLVRRAENFELYVNLVSRGDELLVECSYNADLFGPAMISTRLAEFETLLRAVCADPSRAIDELHILGPAQVRQITQDWNDTARAYGGARTLPGLLEEAVTRWPDEIAIAAPGIQWTYREFDRRVAALAARLGAEGVRRDDFVALHARASPGMVVALHAIVRAGGAYLPLEPEYPAERLASMVEESGCRLVLAEDPKALALEQGASAVRVLGLTACLEPASGIVEPVSALVDPGQAAYLLYTSGSTGRPKGVVLEHRSVVNRLRWGQERYPLGPGDRVLQKTAFSFDVSVPEFFGALMSGATLVLATPEGPRDAAYLVETIQRERITRCHFVPTMLGLFLEQPHASRCTTLKDVFASGEALTRAHVRRFLNTLPAAKLHNLYGPTEAAVEVSWWDCDSDGEARGRVPIGRPIANTQLFVLDELGRPAPVGVRGALYIGGVQLARGYLAQEELTAERFIVHPRHGRLYRTGDFARWMPAGCLDFLGRDDGQVKLRGYRIELGEIEARLRELPQVAECTVALRERLPGDARLVAWIVPAAGAAALAETTPAHALALHLPAYMVPQSFVAVGHLPRLASGKIDHNALPDPFVGQAGTARRAAPGSAQERELCALIGEMLGIEDVGRDDRFLELGGHSLLAVQLANRLEERHAVRLPLRAILLDPIASLASRLPARDASPGPASTPAPRTTRATALRKPYFFGDAGRQLFGVLNLPAESPRRTAILICNSWGAEYMRTYRALYLLAEGLMHEGFPVLRFDYSATGDSAGYSVEASVHEWIGNIGTAADELRRQSGAARLCVIGLRLGALLAGQAIQQGVDAADLVMWDPPADGAHWLGALREFDDLEFEKLNSQRARHARLPPLPPNQLLGMPLTPALREELEALAVRPGGRARRLLVTSSDYDFAIEDAARLTLPNQSHWSRLAWVHTPWVPGQSLSQLAGHLAEQLP